MNLRERAVADVKTQNLKNWGMPVELIDPDGTRYDTDYETGEQLQALQITYSRRSVDPETGEPVVVPEICVVMALSSFERAPAAGETWAVALPLDPSLPDVLTQHVFTPDRSSEGGNSLGIARIYPQAVQQS